MFIASDNLLSTPDAREVDSSSSFVPVFSLSEQAVKLARRLREAGFMVIGMGHGELFHGFASKDSCGRFLTDASLDDVIIPQGDDACGPSLIHAAGKWLLDLDQSFFISGDDAALNEARNTGCQTIKSVAATHEERSPESSGTIADQILRMTDSMPLA